MGIFCFGWNLTEHPVLSNFSQLDTQFSPLPDFIDTFERNQTLFSKAGKIKFIAFLSENDTKLNHWDSYFEKKDFGWNGLINNLDLQEFIDTEFDILISYYKKDNLELNYATACSKANFKVGLSNHNQNLNDIIIDISPNFIDIFGKELEKYLTGLKKIG